MRGSLERIIRIKNPGAALRVILFPLYLCSLLFGCIVSVRAVLYRWSVLRKHRLSCSVVAVGNITVGGTGKTPTVCRIARYMQQQGCAVAVVTRGYGGGGDGAVKTVSDGTAVCADAADAGDEACMLAGALPGIPVITGRNRAAAGVLAVERFGARLVIMDDGFQHFRLERDADIVLINARDPFGNGCLLPRGTLRERPRALRRASLILITKMRPGDACLQELQQRIRGYNTHAPIFSSSFRIAGLKRLRDGTAIPLKFVAGKRAVGLCSIGDPESFFSLLENLDLQMTERIIFPDHHGYQQKDYNRIAQAGGRADYVITTEKDAAKIDRMHPAAASLAVAGIEQCIEEEDLFMQRLKEAGNIS